MLTTLIQDEVKRIEAEIRWLGTSSQDSQNPPRTHTLWTHHPMLAKNRTL